MTGTVLSGSISVGDTIDFPTIRTEKKVKSIQMFHTPVQTIYEGRVH